MLSRLLFGTSPDEPVGDRGDPARRRAQLAARVGRRRAQPARQAALGDRVRPAAHPRRRRGDRARHRAGGGQVPDRRHLCRDRHRRARLHRDPARDRADQGAEPAVVDRVVRRIERAACSTRRIIDTRVAGPLPATDRCVTQRIGRGRGMTEHFDVVVVGAGISGIGAGYHLQTRCPDRSYVILEGARGDRRDVGPVPLSRHPLRHRHAHARLRFQPWTQAQGDRRRPVDPRLCRGDRARATASTGTSASATSAGAPPGRPRTRAGRCEATGRTGR